MRPAERPHRGTAVFAALGRAVVRRPLVPIAVWVVLLVVAVPFLSHLGSVTTNSTNSLPSNAPSARAQEKFDRLFPNMTAPSSALVLVYGSNVVGPRGQGLVLNLTAALSADPALVDVGSVSSVYTAYAAYLAGETRLAAGAVVAAQAGSPNVTEAVTATAGLLWGPPALFVTNWEALVNTSTGPVSSSNAPAYNETRAALNGSAVELAVLSDFYGGYAGSTTGFNGSRGDCAAVARLASALVACAEGSLRANVLPALPTLSGVNATVGGAVLSGMGLENASSTGAVRQVSAALIGAGSGFSAAWVLEVWGTFGPTVPSASTAASFANTTVASTTLAHEPLPVPLAISSEFVDTPGTASIVSVSFTVPDDTSDGSGGNPVYADLGGIDSVSSRLVAATGGAFAYYETGPAALDQLSSQATASSLQLVLPLTVGLLLGIAMVYFRSPLAPAVAFAALGVALLLGLGGSVLLGTFVSHFDSTAIVLEEVFVLGVGTDYSIFLLARYREELVRGRTSDEAIVSAVTWAGQSIAISGSTAIIVTVALTFSGVALLSQWGMVLSVAILVTIFVALTLLPAFLKLFGPRIFWPLTRERFARAARVTNERALHGSTYFYRAARLAKRRPVWIVAVILVVSVPLVAIALEVPVSYDFYGQLPGGHAATQGLSQLSTEFGPGFAVPSFGLVTFSQPLVVANVSNAAEFTEVAALAALAAGAGGIAFVRSPVGPYGANLSAWLGLATDPTPVRANLLGTLAGYLGTDGRTVLFQLQTTAAGLSTGAVSAVHAVQGAFEQYAATHPDVTAVSFGGGAPTIGDLAQETALATEVMLLAVAVGLVLVLLVVLRSWIIALMAVATIGLSISWAWALTYLVLQHAFGVPVFFYVRTILIMLVLGLGIDYNIFLLTRIREERLRGRNAEGATVEAVGRTGGIITAAAVILASAFGALLVGEFTLIRAIGFAVAVAVVLDAMVVRTFLVPASLQLLGERVWTLSGRKPGTTPSDGAGGGTS